MEFLESERVSSFLGLSRYEAMVYVSLVTEGASEARRLSMRCGVPRTKVYPTLKKLMERGLVFELPESPRKFAPRSPSEAFKKYLWHFREKTSSTVISMMEIRKLISLLEEAYKKTQATVSSRKEEVWVFRGWPEMCRKMREMLSQAKRSVTAVATDKGFVLFYKTFDKLLDKLVEKDVDVQLGTPINRYNARLARELNYVYKVEHVDFSSPLIYLCVDDRLFFLAKFNLNDVNFESGESFGVFCNSLNLRNLFSLLIPIIQKVN